MGTARDCHKDTDFTTVRNLRKMEMKTRWMTALMSLFVFSQASALETACSRNQDLRIVFANSDQPLLQFTKQNQSITLQAYQAGYWARIAAPGMLIQLKYQDDINTGVLTITTQKNHARPTAKRVYFSPDYCPSMRELR